MNELAEAVLALIALIALIGLTVGMVRPRWVRQGRRAGVAKIYGLGTLASFIVIGVIAEPVEPVERTAVAEEAEPPVVAVEAVPEPAPIVYEPMRAEVQISELQVRVTNANDYPWRQCEVRINPGVLNDGWTQGVPIVAPGDTVAGGLMAFTRSGGERFNPATHAVETIAVACQRAPDEYGYVSFSR